MTPARRLLAGALTFLGLTCMGLSEPSARAAPAPAPIPASWRAYAELVSRTLPAWLDEPSDAAARVRGRLEASGVTPAADGYQLPLNVWATSDGRISRVEAPGLGDEQTVVALRTVMQGRQLPEAPPSDLRWPIRLLLKVAPQTAPPGPAAPAPK